MQNINRSIRRLQDETLKLKADAYDLNGLVQDEVAKPV
jgi:hypothetical protein